jgi:hypothetical protein
MGILPGGGPSEPKVVTKAAGHRAIPLKISILASCAPQQQWLLH